MDETTFVYYWDEPFEFVYHFLVISD